MSAKVVYSMCWRLNGDAAAFRRHLEMTEIWLAHLRGPGTFTGRVLLMSNLPRLPFADVEVIRLDVGAQDRASLFLQRVLAYDRLPARDGESWMQLDTDSLAVRPIQSLFARPDDTGLQAAPSGLTPLHPMHARTLVPRPARLWYGWVRRWNHRLGVSACVTSCAGGQWHRLMARWAEVIARHRGRPVPELGDQSFLNALYMTGRLPIRPFPAGAIHHVRDEADMHADAVERAQVLHFPNARKLDMMKRMSVA